MRSSLNYLYEKSRPITCIYVGRPFIRCVRMRSRCRKRTEKAPCRSAAKEGKGMGIPRNRSVFQCVKCHGVFRRRRNRPWRRKTGSVLSIEFPPTDCVSGDKLTHPYYTTGQSDSQADECKFARKNHGIRDVRNLTSFRGSARRCR